MKITAATLILLIPTFLLASCAAAPAMQTPTPLPTATSLPVATASPAPTLTVSPQPTGSWTGLLTARMPTLEETNQDSIWVATSVDPADLYNPGTESYSGQVQAGQAYLFPAYWCATTPDVLRQDMQGISTQLLVNGEIVPEQFIFTYNYDTNTNWHCAYHSVILGGWKTNTKYTLEVRRTLAAQVFDGQSYYAAGDYVYRLTINVP